MVFFHGSKTRVLVFILLNTCRLSGFLRVICFNNFEDYKCCLRPMSISIIESAIGFNYWRNATIFTRKIFNDYQRGCPKTKGSGVHSELLRTIISQNPCVKSTKDRIELDSDVLALYWLGVRTNILQSTSRSWPDKFPYISGPLCQSTLPGVSTCPCQPMTPFSSTSPRNP